MAELSELAGEWEEVVIVLSIFIVGLVFSLVFFLLLLEKKFLSPYFLLPIFLSDMLCGF